MTIPSAALRYTLCVAISFLTLMHAKSAMADQARSVIELFTSQGCSSCPPADRVLADLAREPGIIAISLPVDYWDSLGWKDTLAQHAFTERQHAYAEARGDGQVYTPQAVVNGKEHAVGSSRSEVNAAISNSASSLLVPVTISQSSTRIHIAVGSLDAAQLQTAMLIALPIIRSRSVSIGRGENTGRSVTYTNIVRKIIPLGTVDGKCFDL